MSDTRVALVTGSSRGIGRAIAEHLGAAGMTVAVNYRSGAEAADEVVATIESGGGRAASFGADVSEPAAVDGLLEAVADRLGPIQVLVNNAGITDDDLLLRMKPESWERVIATNLTSAFLTTKAVLRGMLKGRWGRIINISSVSGIAGNAGQANYAAAKAGLIGFTKSVAREVGSRGITANVVAPGFIETDMTEELSAEVRESVLPTITLGRFGTPAEVAAAVGYLASDAAAYVTGQVLVVDGGLAL
jgi:3-oxoacyl-[acyl-carrier protein] reductase